MRQVRYALFLCAMIMVMDSCKKSDHVEPVQPVPVVIQPPPAFGYYVVGYFPSYRTLSDVPDIKFRMCNVVNYAFFGVNASGALTVNNPSLVPQVIAKAKANNAKIF